MTHPSLDFSVLPPREQGRLLELLVKHTRDYAVFEIDAAGDIRTCTDSFSRIFGHEAGAVLGRNLTSLYPDGQRNPERMTNLIADALTTGLAEEEGNYQRENSQIFSARTTFLLVSGSTPPRFVVAIRDQTLLVASHEQLRSLLTLDDLTGLNNHQHTLEIGRVEYRRWQRYHVPVSMILCELRAARLDEKIQRDMADILRQSMREVDIAARLEEGLFCALMFSTPLEGACTVAERLRHAIDKVGLKRTHHPAVTVNMVVTTANGSADSFNTFYRQAAVTLRNMAENGGDNLVVL